ncbi:MAG: T9SS type A sorting domain-containing protein [Lentimicrobium sp.]
MKKAKFLFSIQVCLILAGTCALGQTHLRQGNKLSDFLKMDGDFSINPELVQTAAPYSQSNASIAFTGDIYLVVWHDSRGQEGHIYGARVDMDGNLLDPAGIVICNEPGYQTSPAVATNGEFFMVVWRDERNDDSEDDIYGSRVSLDGTILDPGGFPICTAEDDQDDPVVAGVGTGFCVVWSDYRKGNDQDIYANLISTEGTISHTNGFPLCSLPSYQSYPDICSDGSRYLIVWGDGRNADEDIFGTFVETNGMVSHPEGTAIAALPNDQNHPAVCSGGEQFFLAWEDDTPAANETIRGARISNTGALLDPNGIAISAHPDFYCVWPDVCYDGNNFWIAYAKGVYGSGYNFDILSSRITTGGLVLDPSGIILAGTENREEFPVLAFDGQQMLICRQEIRNTSDIYGTFCDLQGNISPEDGILLSVGYNNQLFSKAGFDGTNYMAIWIDTRNDNAFDIYAARVSQSGTLIDQQAIPVVTGAGDCSYPAICFNGTYYLVAWEHGSDLFGARINTDGQVLDPGGFVIYQGGWTQSRPAIASDGQHWMVVWEDGRNSTGSDYHMDIYGTLISNDGTLLYPQGFPVIAFETDQKNSAIIYDGTNYVVAWEDYRAGFFGEPAIYGARITTGATVLDANGVALAENEDLAMNKPALAHSGGILMVCFTEENYYEEIKVVKFVRFTPQMIILDNDPVAIDAASTSQDASAVVSFGDQFFIIWTDNTDLPYNHIARAIVNTDGTITELGVFGQTGEYMSAPSLTAGPSGKVFGLFSAFTVTFGEDTINAVRLYGMQYAEGVGIADLLFGVNIHAWPNPTTGQFSIQSTEFNHGMIHIELTDIYGKCLETRDHEPALRNPGFDITHLPSGIYFIRVSIDNQMIVKKLIKF